MRKAKEDNEKVKLARDTLFIDGEVFTETLIDPRVESQLYSQKNHCSRLPKERPRQTSTPDREGQGHKGEQLKLKFLTLNVCGLRQKLQYPGFSIFISRYDILCLTETNTDKTYAIDMPGFCVFMKNKFDIPTVKSRGIIIAVKTNHVKFFLLYIRQVIHYFIGFHQLNHCFIFKMIFKIIPPKKIQNMHLKIVVLKKSENC